MAQSELYGFTLSDGVRMICQRFWPIVIAFVLGSIAAILVQYAERETRYRAVLELRVEPRADAPARLRALMPDALTERIAAALPQRALGEERLSAVRKRLREEHGVGLDRQALAARLRAEHVGGGVIRIACEHADGRAAGAVTRAAVEAFEREYAGMEAMRHEIVRQNLEADLAEAGNALVRIEGAVESRIAALPAGDGDEAAADGIDAFDPDAARAAMDARLAALAARRIELETAIAAREKTRREHEGRLADPDAVVLREAKQTTVPTPAGARLRRERRMLAEDLTAKLRISTERHPHVRELRREIALIDRKIEAVGLETKTVVETRPNPKAEAWRAAAREAGLAADRLRDDLEALAAELKTARARAAALPEHLREIAALRRERDLLLAERTRLRQTRAALGRGGPDAPLWGRTVLHRETVVIPLHDDISPTRVLAMTLLAGGLAALVTLLVAEYTDQSLKSLDDARRHFDVPVLGAVREYTVESTAPLGETLRAFVYRILHRGEREELGRSRQKIVVRARFRPLRVLLAVAILTGLLLLLAQYADLRPVVDYARRIVNDLFVAAPADPADAPASGAPGRDAAPKDGSAAAGEAQTEDGPADADAPAGAEPGVAPPPSAGAAAQTDREDDGSAREGAPAPEDTGNREPDGPAASGEETP